ncbi:MULTISPECIES: glycosyl hydrolase family 8 [unclassified Clostridium]|uniref:glycosyl hydrolase family 8 n=1 Tax=unclassified Clostridium TaxID=2614128 RepID=UPI00029760E1|nr:MULTISPECIES: glycosyl hydrolase family 8 [unclassified Clostridium]EKQ51692.1 MAG: endoglucanase Y [Clostridium sp. Maddingley MBC34-26]
MTIIYNDTLVNYYSQSNLNLELLSFYNDWKIRYLRPTNDFPTLKEYLFYALDQPAPKNAVTVSEAMGYGMIIFPLMSKFDLTAKIHFTAIYNYIKSYQSFYNPNLMAWQQIKDSNGNIINAEAETSSATDGDMDISYGLLLAHKIWGENDKISYKNEAIKRINALMDSCVNENDYILTLGDWVKGSKINKFQYVTRSSDFLKYHIREFCKFDVQNSHKWQMVINKIDSIISKQMQKESKSNGLMPDFFIKYKDTYIAPKIKILETVHDGDYYFNSCRIPWRYSMDIIINKTPVTEELHTLNNWIKKNTSYDPENISSGYYIANGPPGSSFGSKNNLSFIAPFLVSSLIEKEHDHWTISLWETLIQKPISKCTFYENTLKLLAMIVATGNWYID